jgi:hypothetical protein
MHSQTEPGDEKFLPIPAKKVASQGAAVPDRHPFLRTAQPSERNLIILFEDGVQEPCRKRIQGLKICYESGQIKRE